MEQLFIHLLKSSLLLSLFLAAYQFLLRKETDLTGNRVFLLAGILSAAILPFVHFTRTVVVEVIPSATGRLTPAAGGYIATLPQARLDLWELAGCLYILVAVILLGRMLYQILQILWLARTQSIEKKSRFLYVETSFKTSPFSFFNLIVYNPATHPEEELEMVLEHERVHSRQLHSLDIILANLAAALLWFNPLSWVYRNRVEENLEFIADRKTMNSFSKLKEYQYALLRVSQQTVYPGLLNHFHNSFIRSRILMLGTPRKAETKNWKRLLILPFLLFFLLGFNTREEFVFSEKSSAGLELQQEPVFYIDHTTTDAYLRGMEAYFRKQHPGLHIAFTGITRDPDLFMTGFQLKTKFRGEARFTKRMENLGEGKLKPRFEIRYSEEEKGLLFTEIAEVELTMLITREAIHVDRTALIK